MIKSITTEENPSKFTDRKIADLHISKICIIALGSFFLISAALAGIMVFKYPKIVNNLLGKFGEKLTSNNYWKILSISSFLLPSAISFSVIIGMTLKQNKIEQLTEEVFQSQRIVNDQLFDAIYFDAKMQDGVMMIEKDMFVIDKNSFIDEMNKENLEKACVIHLNSADYTGKNESSEEHEIIYDEKIEEVFLALTKARNMNKEIIIFTDDLNGVCSCFLIYYFISKYKVSLDKIREFFEKNNLCTQVLEDSKEAFEAIRQELLKKERENLKESLSKNVFI